MTGLGTEKQGDTGHGLSDGIRFVRFLTSRVRPVPQVYWFKDGKQISKRSEHYRISRDPDGTCSLHTAAASLDDDGNYTIMAGNPAVSAQQHQVSVLA